VLPNTEAVGVTVHRGNRSIRLTQKENLVKRLLSIVAVLLVAGAGSARALEPANPKTNAQARAILNYLEGLPQRADKRLLSGQFTSYGPKANQAACAEVHQTTGHWPAIIGLDYADFDKGGLETKTVNRVAIEYARQGGLVTISAHLYNPANPKGGGLRDQGVDLKPLLAPGNETHDRWMKELDTMAAGLKELQDAHVVVLWRPLHEMNGDWFWWGGKDPETFIQVWRQMFDYFTKTKGLDNLLWVYSPNHGEKTADYYAGDHYVDIVGLDAYTDFVDPQHIRGYDAVAKLPKPFGFTEFGPHGPDNPPGDYDYLRFLDGVRKHFHKTTFVLAWNWNWGLGRNHNTKQLLEHPWLVNREDLPAEWTTRPK
jgi:mannan endo-1,4-beta-mannosidase